MSTYNYMAGRKKYGKPQAMLFANNPGQIVSSTVEEETFYGYAPAIGSIEREDFIILSDHNRSPISFSPTRIENRQRMINGRMRSYHIADKQTISTSWTRLPSRSFADEPNFDSNGIPDLNVQATRTTPSEQYTVDGGAGGAELLEWYDQNPGSFWVYLAYDNYPSLKNLDPANDNSWNPYNHMNMYNEVIEVFFSSFSHTVEKRGGLYDFWDISLSLEEV